MSTADESFLRGLTPRERREILNLEERLRLERDEVSQIFTQRPKDVRRQTQYDPHKHSATRSSVRSKRSRKIS